MSLFLDERGKITLKGILIGVLILVIIFAVIFFLPMLFSNGDSNNNESSQDTMDIESNIPTNNNENVNIEKDEEITYIERKELEQILKNRINEQIANINNNLDKEIKDLVDTLREERKKVEKQF